MMTRTQINLVLILAVLAVVFGCDRFDRSRIQMPAFNFVTRENLHSIARVGAQHIWVSGNYGTILCSADGGKTWEKQNSGIAEELLGCISFVNPQEGWAAGVRGTIVHTADGGKTWGVQPSGIEQDIHDIFFLDAHYGWAVGESGTVLHTDDGGKHWKRQREPEDRYFNDVFFVDRKTGWIVGEFGTILHSADGGATWQPQECPELAALVKNAEWDRPLPALYGTYFPDKDRGWIVGMDGVIIRTENGGKTWSLVKPVSEKPLYSIVMHGAKGWAVGNEGVYVMTENGGDTWSVKDQALKTKFWLRAVSFGDDKRGLIVGAQGTIALTDDGGFSWKLISGYSYDMKEFGLADF